MRTLTNTLARATAVASVAVGLAVTVPSAAQAKDKTDLVVSGYAAAQAPVAGVVSFAGFVTGDPFHAMSHTGAFGPDDGTLPQSLACEPASGSLTISSSKGSVTFAVAGEMCDQFGTYPTFGTWSVTAASGDLAKAKGSGMFSWNTQWWGTQWQLLGTFKA